MTPHLSPRIKLISMSGVWKKRKQIINSYKKFYKYLLLSAKTMKR